MNPFLYYVLFRDLLVAVALFSLSPVAGWGASKDKAPASPRTPAGKRAESGQKVDINTADQKTLESLSGVGPEIAREIIAARPFKSVDDLERVRGIGPERLEVLRAQVMVSQTVAPVKRKLGEPTGAPTGRTTASPAAAQKPVNINTASQQELEVLPGIGPVKAAEIIEARMERPFSSKEDIMRVKGIKEGTFKEIEGLITIK